MTELLHISLPIKPIPLKRHRTRFGRTYDPQSAVKIKFANLVKKQIPHGYDPSGPKTLTVEFAFEMPKSWSTKKKLRYLYMPHEGKIDCDNLIKFVGDALNGVLWEDDCHIHTISATKIWSDKNSIDIQVS